MASRALLWLALLLAIKGRSAESAGAPSAWGEERPVTGVSIALSEETADAPVSLFGHLFAVVRTADRDGAGWPLRLETAINVAVATDGPLDEAAFRRLPVHRMLHEANTKERRNVVMVDLELSPEDVRRLGEELRSRLHMVCRYDLLRRNCAFYILDWLSTVRPAMRSEVKWRPVWTPRQAMQLIERHFGVTKRTLLPATSLGESSATAISKVGVSGRVIGKDWARTEEGVRVAGVFAKSLAGESAGISLGLGHRDHATSPLGEESTSHLAILSLTHLYGEKGNESKLTLLEFENLREIRGKTPRLSQRLEISWQDMQRTDSLEGFVAQFETGASTRLAGSTWLAAMAGLSLSDDTAHVIRPLGSVQALWLSHACTIGIGYRTTGGDNAGIFSSASFRLAEKTHLSLQLIDSEKSGSRTELSLSRRL
jgi:hypothetical protein